MSESFGTPMDCSLSGSSVHGIFHGKNTGVVLPFPSPGDLPDPGMETTSPELAGRFFTTEPPGKPPHVHTHTHTHTRTETYL